MREENLNAQRPSTQQPGSEEAQATEKARCATGFFHSVAAAQSALILSRRHFDSAAELPPRLALGVDAHCGTGARWSSECDAPRHRSIGESVAGKVQMSALS
jgi:hypothetical protein